MKRLIILTLACFIHLLSNAQLNKGNFLLGGSGNFYTYKENYRSANVDFDANYTDINLNASLGYFVADKLVLGIKPTFSSTKGNSSGGGTTNAYQIGIGPFVRYYFLKEDKPFNFLSEVSYQIGSNRYLSQVKEKGKNNNFSILAGPEIFFNTTVGLELLFGYSVQTVSITNSPGEFINKKSGFQTSIGFQIHLDNFKN